MSMNGRNAQRRRERAKADRDGTGFVALPHVVIDAPAWAKLSWPARSLLIELARQCLPNMNGRLLATTKLLEPRGFNSHETVGRALAELERAGFIYKTCQGGRPARASRYAVTWRSLDAPRELFDHDACRTFQRGAYLQTPPRENAALIPMSGAAKASGGPIIGAAVSAKGTACPDDRVSTGRFTGAAAPTIGEHLEKPSAAQRAAGIGVD
jgi:hypothetical protein